MVTDADERGQQVSYETIAYQMEDDGLAIITLNRPEQLNALSSKVMQEIGNVVKAIRNDDNVRVLILTGTPRPNGQPWFSAGIDVKEMSRWDSEAAARFTLEGNAVLNDIEELPKPTIAAIDGTCTTGGLALILAFDMRIAADTAQFSDWHVKNIGGLDGWGIPARLPRLVGLSKAKEIIWTGDVISGDDALRIGLVNRVYPSRSMMNETKSLARKIALMPPLSVEVNKTCINMAMHLNLQQALDFIQTQRSRLEPPRERAQSFLSQKSKA